MDKFEKNNLISTQANPTRSVYSTPSRFIDDRISDNCKTCNSEGDVNNDTINVGTTDSEITVLRIKMESNHLKSSENNWNVNDSIPGDGSHLGNSASLVNLATYMSHNKSLKSESSCGEKDEYLVPLSSWDLGDKIFDYRLQNFNLTDNVLNTNTTQPITSSTPDFTSNDKRTSLETNKSLALTSKSDSLARRFKRFLKKTLYKKS